MSLLLMVHIIIRAGWSPSDELCALALIRVGIFACDRSVMLQTFKTGVCDHSVIAISTH
jgi:hypothetical protein